MTNAPIEIEVSFIDRKPLTLKTELDSPILKQLCFALANRKSIGDNVMHLVVEETDVSNIYFPVSALAGIESDVALPAEYFSSQNEIKVENYLHLNMDRKWIDWAIEGMQRGMNNPSLYKIMYETGVDHEAICELLDYYPPESNSPIEHPNRETIYPLAGAHVDKKYRIKSDYMELYCINRVLTPLQCQGFIDAIGEDVSRSKIGGKKNFYEGRTSDTYFFPNSGEVLPIVSDLQEKIAEILKLELKHFESLHCNIYREGQQFRAHTDYFTGKIPTFINRSGDICTGQRQWSIVIYLNELESGCGIRFQRLAMDYDPQPGTALIWNNLFPSGKPNPYSLHSGRPAGKQNKYMLAQFTRLPEGT